MKKIIKSLYLTKQEVLPFLKYILFLILFFAVILVPVWYIIYLKKHPNFNVHPQDQDQEQCAPNYMGGCDL